ncbi:MAG: SCO family protein [Haloferacaceae archaeon]
MYRRRLLRGLTAGGLAPLAAGCLGGRGGGSDSSSHTHLDRPESQRADSADLPYPAWSQQLPTATLPDPLAGESVTTTQYEGERNVMLTCFYSHCPNVCQQMIGQMRNVQADAVKNGYADEVAFLAITFDPERDTKARLAEYAKEKHVALDAGNWHFLRPNSVSRAKAVVTEKFGIKFQKRTPTGRPSGAANGTGTGTATGTTTATGTGDGTTTATATGKGSGYFFTHIGLVFLVNVDGYVERAYQFAQSGNPPWQDRRDDLKTLVDREG